MKIADIIISLNYSRYACIIQIFQRHLINVFLLHVLEYSKMANLQQILDRTNIKEMQNIIDNLEEGEKHVEYSIDKNVILILGKAGSGKTILTQFMAGNEDLVSEKLEYSPVGYYIQEKNQTTKFSDNWQNFVPKLVHDTKTNTTFYDCPGFLNTINEINDISAGYYLKNIIDSSGSVKLVFTITHDSLRDERDFLSQLVKPAIRLVKNIEKFKNSIALVVTEVMDPKEFRNNRDKVLDESVIRGIGNYLRNLTDELERHVANNRLIYSKEIYSDGLPFIKTLLHLNREQFTKIGIFKMPNSSGKLTNMTLLQENEESLKKIIYEKIEFSPHINDKDFGYSISEESKLYIKSLANEINEKVASEIRKIGEQIERHYHNQEKQMHDIKVLRDQLHSSYKTLSNTQSEIFDLSEPQHLVAQITKNINDLNIDDSSNSTFDLIADYAEYIKFLRNLVDNESNLIDPCKWAQAMTNILRFLDDSHKWYNFLNNLPIILSKYDVQRDLTQYTDAIRTFQSRIADYDDNKRSIMESLKVLSYKISKEDFERELIEIKDKSLDNHKLKHLTHILNLTLKNNTTSIREGDKLIIKSRYVKLSDIANEDFTHVKSVEILALNKVFIDASLNMTADLSQIFIISPEWEIIGLPEIRLNNKSKPDDNVKSLVGIGQHFHGHAYLSIVTKKSEAKNEQSFGKNIKVIGEEESLVKNDNDFVDADYVKIVKLSDNFDVSVNGLLGRIQFNNTLDKKIMRIQNVQPEVDTRVHSAINDFKSYARECLTIDVQESFLRNFVELLENHKYVKNSYSPLGFVSELYDIEDQFFTLGKDISFLPFYKSLLRRLNEYAENNNNNKLTNDDKKVLSYLNAVIMSKIYCSDDDIPDYFAKDLKKTLKTVIEDIEQLTRSNNLNDTIFINDCRLNEQKLIKETSNDVHHFIDMRIKPNMDISFLKIDKASSEELIKVKMLMSISEKLTEFLDFISLIGPRAASIIKRNNITNESSSSLDNTAKIYNMYPITDLLTEVQNFDLKLKNQLENKKLLLKEILIKIGQELKLFLTKHSSNELSNIVLKISEMEQRLNEKITDFLSMDELYNIQGEVAELLQKQKESLERQASQKYEGFEDQLNLVNRMIKIANMAQFSVKFYNEIKNDETKINNFWETIKHAEDDVKQLVQYEKNIYYIMVAAHTSVNNSVKETEKVLQIQSYAALSVTKWQLQMTLKNLLHKLQTLTKTYSFPKQYEQNIDKLEKSTASLISMYDQIENLHNKMQLVVYVANIKSSKETKLKLQSETLNTAINKLKLIMRSNLVLKKKESAINMFKQHLYPFSNYFFGKYELPPALQITDRNSLVSDAASSLDSLRYDYVMSTITLTKMDEISYVRTTSDDEFERLFKWNHHRNKESIIFKLFEGKEIEVKSDIYQSLFEVVLANAVKFNEVRVNFKVANETMQIELNKHLENFKITMKHSGKSYYRCDDQIHVIPSDSFTISFSLAKDKDGNPLKTNEIYDKLKKHQAVLSPFTTWHIQLSNMNGDDFSSLAKYRNEAIDLELEAKVDYIWNFNDRTGICNDDLNNYYTLYGNDPNTRPYRTPSDRYFKREIPKIQSDTRSNRGSGKNLYRKRRGVFAQIANDEPYEHATSGASSSMKSSIANTIVDIIGTHLVALRYWNPIDKISAWFANDDRNIISKESHIFSHAFVEDKTSTMGGAFGYSSFCNHGNLLLLDLMIRQKNGIKYKQQDFEMTKAHDCEYAQNLAYREYVPDL